MRMIKQVGQYNRSNNGTEPFQQDRVYNPNGIAPALSAQLKGLLIILFENIDT